MAVRKTKKGAALKRWFKEEWKDEKGNVCGSTKNKNTKKCRPSKRVSSKTPKTGKKCHQLKKRKLWLKRKEQEWVKEHHH